MQTFPNVNQIAIYGTYMAIEFVEHTNDFVGLVVDDPDKLIHVEMMDSGKLKISSECEIINNNFIGIIIANGQVINNQSNKFSKILPKMYVHINNSHLIKLILINITGGQINGDKILSNFDLTMSGGSILNMHSVCNDTTNIDCSGNSEIHIGSCKCEDFEISSSGNCSVVINTCDTQSMKWSMSGNVSGIISAGTCKKINASLSGNSKLNSSQTITSKMRASSSGCSNATFSDCRDEDPNIVVSGCSCISINGNRCEKKTNRCVTGTNIVFGNGNVVITGGNVVQWF